MLFLELQALLLPPGDKLPPVVDDLHDSILIQALLYIREVVKAGVHAIDTDRMEVTFANCMASHLLLKHQSSMLSSLSKLVRHQVLLLVLSPEDLNSCSCIFTDISN